MSIQSDRRGKKRVEGKIKKNKIIITMKYSTSRHSTCATGDTNNNIK